MGGGGGRWEDVGGGRSCRTGVEGGRGLVCRSCMQPSIYLVALVSVCVFLCTRIFTHVRVQDSISVLLQPPSTLTRRRPPSLVLALRCPCPAHIAARPLRANQKSSPGAGNPRLACLDSSSHSAARRNQYALRVHGNRRSLARDAARPRRRTPSAIRAQTVPVARRTPLDPPRWLVSAIRRHSFEFPPKPPAPRFLRPLRTPRRCTQLLESRRPVCSRRASPRACSLEAAARRTKVSSSPACVTAKGAELTNSTWQNSRVCRS